jgi:hypothetical protein
MGAFTNHGTFKSTNTVVTFAGTYTEKGAFVSDPSTNFFVDLNIGTTGYLTGGLGDRFVISGDFSNASTQSASWNTTAAELAFSGGSGHLMAMAGKDLGPSFFGYVNNFAWGTMRLSPGQSLTLSDGNAISGAAIYVDKLILEGGVAQISLITGNGFNIYYNPFDAANAYLGGASYPLSGGGAIAPVAAAIQVTSIARLPNGHVLLQCLGAPNRSHTIAASADLIAPFSSIGAGMAAPDGTFQFEDVNSANLSKRFYRLVFP